MIIVVGEILIDHFPEYERIGGAPFNFAYHLKKMGWPVQFITRIGDDTDSEKIIGLLERSGFDLGRVQVDESHATGRVEVTLDANGVPDFDICEDVAYDHIDLSSVGVEHSEKVEMIYFGTLIQRTDEGFRRVQRFLENTASNATRFCDINFRAPHIHVDAVEASLGQADILKLNDDELDHLRTLFNGPEGRTEGVDWLMKSYDIGTVALTLGADGSTAYAGGRTFHCPPAKLPEIMDTVGAGDAYASVLAAGSLNQLPMDHTLDLAGNFAADVCGMPGAIPDDPTVYAALITELERNRNAQ